MGGDGMLDKVEIEEQLRRMQKSAAKKRASGDPVKEWTRAQIEAFQWVLERALNPLEGPDWDGDRTFG